MRRIGEVALREAVVLALFFLPARRKRSLERWLRGWEESRKLRAADCVIVSWGKSGRTWLRLMLSRFYQVAYGLPEGSFLEFDNLHRRDARIPRAFFTHGNYLRDYTGNWSSKSDFRGKKVVLLVRDPRDVAVSQFFQWKYRMRSSKKELNDYPGDAEDVSIYDFVMKREVGLERVVEFFNAWAEELEHRSDALVVRYEDLRADPRKHFAEVLAFMGAQGTDEQIEDAIRYAQVDNMRNLESRGAFRWNGRRMRPRDRSDPNSYKVRRAKVGGYRDYFESSEIDEIDGFVEKRLSPVYGYSSSNGGALPLGAIGGGG